MKCKNCGAEISSMRSKCEYCGHENTITVQDIQDRIVTNGYVTIEYFNEIIPSYRDSKGMIKPYISKPTRKITIIENC